MGAPLHCYSGASGGEFLENWGVGEIEWCCGVMVEAKNSFRRHPTSDGLHSWMILKCSVDYATITLQLCKQKKQFMFYYRDIIYVEIVPFDIYPTNSPSNKQHHHGEPFAAMAAWLKQIGSPHPWGPLRKGSSEVAVKGFQLH
jgi:hypothetical protein